MDYIDRVNLAVDHIEEHLTDELDLAAVARVANSSLFWFQRIFTAVTGDSLGEYIRKRRLNRAAEELIRTKRRIIDIALEYGFSSHEAFTRAFRKYFAVAPSKYRTAGLCVIQRFALTDGFLRRELEITGGRMNIESVSTRGVRILELPACRMATSKGRSLADFNAWWSELDRTRSDRFFPRDFMYFDPADKELVWLYALPSPGTDAGGFGIVDFSGGLYAASVSIDGNDIDGEKVYADIREWISKTGYFQIDERPRRYTVFHVITSDTAYARMKYRQLDIYVPVS